MYFWMVAHVKNLVEHKNNVCIHLTYYSLLRHEVGAMLSLLFILASLFQHTTP